MIFIFTETMKVVRVVYVFVCVLVFAEARAGRKKIKPIQSDSPQTDYEEYDAEYDYDYDNGTEISEYCTLFFCLTLYCQIFLKQKLTKNLLQIIPQL